MLFSYGIIDSYDFVINYYVVRVGTMQILYIYLVLLICDYWCFIRISLQDNFYNI